MNSPPNISERPVPYFLDPTFNTGAELRRMLRDPRRARPQRWFKPALPSERWYNPPGARCEFRSWLKMVIVSNVSGIASIAIVGRISGYVVERYDETLVWGFGGFFIFNVFLSCWIGWRTWHVQTYVGPRNKAKKRNPYATSFHSPAVICGQGDELSRETRREFAEIMGCILGVGTLAALVTLAFTYLMPEMAFGKTLTGQLMLGTWLLFLSLSVYFVAWRVMTRLYVHKML